MGVALAKPIGLVAAIFVGSTSVEPGGCQSKSRGLSVSHHGHLCRNDMAHIFSRIVLALGGFLGGLVIADAEYGHRAMGDILPLRNAFVSIFFISRGILIDWA